ncbi:MAG: hypothetical protein KKG59_00955 [Nanoarchaeota archaeon]|nr:hypothetical protein [Nanoarchaeota archaeon]
MKTRTDSKLSNSCSKLLLALALIMAIFVFGLVGQAGFASADPVNDTNPPGILTMSPIGYTNIHPVVIELETDEEAACKYDTSELYFDDMEFNFDNYNTTHTVALDLEDESYTYYVACQDVYDNTGLPESLSFILDTGIPEVVQAGPSGVLNDRAVEMWVTTNEDAVCKYATTDLAYDNMQNTFSQTGEQDHAHDIAPGGQGAYSYYVRCQDLAGNQMQISSPIEFSINLEPVAMVSIDGQDVLRAGTYEVTLTTSEEMDEIPLLQYNFNDEVGLKTVSLTGSGTTFNGYMIIPKNNKDRIGTFYFTGTDVDGLQGTEIISGKLFLVDTKDPPPPASLKLENYANGVKISWYYDDEPKGYFNVYRSRAASVGYTHYLDRSSSDVFYDTGVEDGQSYYYRISAVDKAGNEGDLSGERFIVVDYQDEISEKEEQKLSTKLSGSVNSKIKEVESAILDLQAVNLELSNSINPTIINIIDYFDLLENAKSAENSLDQIVIQLESLLLMDLTESDLNARLAKIDNNFLIIRSSVVHTVKIVEETELTQLTHDSDIYGATTEILKDISLVSTVRADYDSKVKSLNDNALVNVRLTNVKLEFFGADKSEEWSIIHKTVNLDDAPANAFVIEVIPKEVVASASDITAMNPPVVIKQDPILKWSPASLQNYEIKYHIKQVNLNSLKTTKTIVLMEPSSSSDGPGDPDDPNDSLNNSITGMVGNVNIREEGGFEFNFSFILLLLAVVCVLGLAVYYVFFLNTEEEYEEDVAGESVSHNNAHYNPAHHNSHRFWKRDRARNRILPSEPIAGYSRNAQSFVRRSVRRERIPRDRSVPGMQQGVQQGVQQGMQQGSMFMAKDMPKQKNVNIIQDSQRMLVSGSQEVLSLLNEGHKMIDNLEFGKAHSFYLTVLDLHNYLGAHTKQGLGDNVNRLYSKLLLFTKIKQAHACVDSSDKEELHRVLYQIDSLSKMLDISYDQSPLSGYIYRAKTYFNDNLKNMGNLSHQYSATEPVDTPKSEPITKDINS